MADSQEEKEDSNSYLASLNELESVRAILFSQEKAQIEQLEEKLAVLTLEIQQQGEAQDQSLQARSAALHEEIEALKNAVQAREEETAVLLARLENLQKEFQNQTETLIPHLTSQMSGMIRDTIHESRDEMAEALGPVMGEAIRVQIRDSRDEMVDVLYPIILSTVQRAIAEFARELQRNIDARLKSTFGVRGMVRSVRARLGGVSHSNLTIRDSLPFSVVEMFLIHHETGLLLAHLSHEEEENGDSDLISGMLTAIRDFARDSFGDGDPDDDLKEIEFGDERVVIQSGKYVYLAVVVTGVEPEWFRARLRTFVSELHIQHAPEFRDYDGDPAKLPALSPMLQHLSENITAAPEEEVWSPTRNQKLAFLGGGLIGLLLLATACFYLQFTLALLPLAFGDTPTPTPEPTATVQPVIEPSPTLAATATFTPLPSPTQTMTPQPTAAPTERPTASWTATAVPTIVPTATAVSPITTSPVWMRSSPDVDLEPTFAIPQGTPLTIIDRLGQWVEVEWDSPNGLQQGWILVQFTNLDEVNN